LTNPNVQPDVSLPRLLGSLRRRGATAFRLVREGNAVPFLRRALGHIAQPDWRPLLRREADKWEAARAAARHGPKVLIATSTGALTSVTPIESLLAVALTLRGADVHILLCDGVLPACLMCQMTEKPTPEPAELARHGPQRSLCAPCFKSAAAMYHALGLTVHRYSDWLTNGDLAIAPELTRGAPRSEIARFRFEDLAVGEHALAGALRYFARADLNGQECEREILERYIEASFLSVFAIQNLLQRHDYASAVFHHGLYVPQGLIGEVFRKKGVRLLNWSHAYRTGCFIFSHGDTHHHTLMSEPTASWENMPWTEEMESQIVDYLKSRWQGSRDWIWFHEHPQANVSEIEREIGIDLSRPTIGMLSNVMWDAQLHYPANAFANMLDWTLRTIEYFAGRPELQLLIRIHPAEIRGTMPSRQPLLEEIKAAFPTLPPNVFIVPPESQVSTYAAMLQCDSVIIYGTKTGVELTSLGVPVIVAGEAWIRNKGLTLDADSTAKYFELLDRLPLGERMSAEQTRRARMYAYHFFFRRMIPLPVSKSVRGLVPFQVDAPSLEVLEPGRLKGLDVICDGILRGTPLIFPAESEPAVT
jgi:hypothetical protein